MTKNKTKTAHEIPRRDSFPLESHISIVSLPFATVMSFLREMAMNSGIIKVRGVGQALVHAAKYDVTVFVDCLQHVKVFPHPGNIVYSACTFKVGDRGNVLLSGTHGLLSLQLEAALDSLDYSGPFALQPGAAGEDALAAVVRAAQAREGL